jgi:hypothetical protein
MGLFVFVIEKEEIKHKSPALLEKLHGAIAFFPEFHVHHQLSLVG